MIRSSRRLSAATICLGSLLTTHGALADSSNACPPAQPDPAFLMAVENASGYANIPYDPLIESAISQVSADSIQAIIERLVAFGNRFTYSDSLAAAETWIADKLESFGGYDPTLQPVSFPFTQRHNVYAELQGTAPEEEWVVVGGHHDSINWTDFPSLDDSYAPAPGADDNGSGTAAVLEMARILAGYALPRTMRFATFTIEELGLVGSERMAATMENQGQSVRLMINLDMVAHDPQGNDQISVAGSDIAETHLVRAVVETYSDHSWVDGGWSSNSDHFSFSEHGHPAVNLIEADFNFGGWHHSSDELWRLDMDYSAESTRIGLATALIAAAYPAPVTSIALSEPEPADALNDADDEGALVASWTSVAGVDRYVLRWGAVSGAPAEEMEVSDTSAVISGLTPNELVYVSVVALDDAGRESWFAPEAADATLSFDQGILLVDETVDAIPAEALQDSLFDVYLQGYEYVQLDLAESAPPTIADLGAYSTVIWIGDEPFQVDLPANTEVLGRYVTRGGNLVLSEWGQLAQLGPPFEEGSFGHDVLGIENVSTVAEEDFAGADPVDPGYTALRTWQRFWPAQALSGAEILWSTENADTLLSFVSASGDTAVHGRPVALRNRGSDGAGDAYTIGAPLLQMEPQGVVAWFRRVLDELGIPVGVEDREDSPPAPRAARLLVHPNPFNPSTTVSFRMDREGSAKVAILDVTGRRVTTLIDRALPIGAHHAVWDGKTASGRAAASGVYVVLLETPQGRWQERMVLLK